MKNSGFVDQGVVDKFNSSETDFRLIIQSSDYGDKVGFAEAAKSREYTTRDLWELTLPSERCPDGSYVDILPLLRATLEKDYVHVLVADANYSQEWMPYLVTVLEQIIEENDKVGSRLNAPIDILRELFQ